MSKEGQQLHDLVAETIDRHRAAPRLKPAAIAKEVLDRLDAEQPSHPLVWVGCNLELRQIARGQLADRFDPIKEDDDAEPELFEGLQWRYPEAAPEGTKRSPDQGYVLRDLMTDADIHWNVNRLRSEASAKLAHADALEAWGSERKRPA